MRRWRASRAPGRKYGALSAMSPIPLPSTPLPKQPFLPSAKSTSYATTPGLVLWEASTLSPSTTGAGFWSGVVNGVRAFLPHMRAHGEGGHIVNTASIAGMINRFHGFHPYPASKYAVVGMSEGLAVELKPFGIGVSVLCPGFVRTNILDSARNRPKRYGPTTPPDAANPLYARLAELARTGMDPAEVAQRVMAAIRNDELYVFPHPETRGAVEERFRAILAAFDRAALPPV